ncbi:MAG: hydroxymethylbilane synthase [Planctomycetota bacterium]|nr:MAG: hydroxymethylbilane synthase [Planctomycetota bacterium]
MTTKGRIALAHIRIGTRGSKLALWQAEWVAGQLTALGHAIELVQIQTEGDRSSQSLRVVGGQGVFTKAIQHALLDERVDVAVHSLKDLPTEPIPGLVLAAVPERESTADALLSRGGLGFEELPVGAQIGTGSLRRAAQLRAWRPDLVIADIRGNVDTRIRKMQSGQFDAIVLAHAGLKRLQLEACITQLLPSDRILPAIGQGALGIECRKDDAETRSAIAALDHPPTHSAVRAERYVLRKLMAGCLAPIAGVGQVSDGRLRVTVRVLAPDGSRCVEAAAEGAWSDPEEVAEQAVDQLRAAGAEEMIRVATQPRRP